MRSAYAVATALQMKMPTAFDDNVDECVGELDACNVCNGPGDVYTCGCTNIPEGRLDDPTSLMH